MKHLILFFVSLLIAFSGFAQNKRKKGCVTVPSESYTLEKITSLHNARLKSGATSFRIRTYITIFADDDGSRPACTEAEINAQIQNLRADYDPYNICFLILGIRQVNNSDLNDMDTDTEERELKDHLVDDCLNLFIHRQFADPDLAGIAYDIPNKYASFLGEDIKDPDFTALLSHEIGHCFGLLHTFETSKGNEHVARSGLCKNCGSAGDLLCSTPADVDSTVNDNCVYTDTVTDFCGDVYTPMTNNIMAYSYGKAHCLDIFTAEQGDRMHDFLNGLTLSSIIVNDNSYNPIVPVLNTNYNSGEHFETAIDNLYISSFTGNEYNVTDSAQVTMYSKKASLQKGTHFKPNSSGKVHIKSITGCY